MTVLAVTFNRDTTHDGEILLHALCGVRDLHGNLEQVSAELNRCGIHN